MLQGRKLLSQSEVLGGKLAAVSDDASNQDENDLQNAHFTGLLGRLPEVGIWKELANVNAVSACLTTSTE